MMRFHRSLTAASALAFSVVIAFAADKPSVFVTGANFLQVAGSSGEAGVSGAADATVAKGIKLFRKGCPSVEVTTQQDKADYIVGVTNSGSGAARRGRRVEVFTPEGAVVFASLTRRLKNAVKDACGAITKGRFPHRMLPRPRLHSPIVHNDQDRGASEHRLELPLFQLAPVSPLLVHSSR